MAQLDDKGDLREENALFSIPESTPNAEKDMSLASSSKKPLAR
jgi:hypothetical protein